MWYSNGVKFEFLPKPQELNDFQREEYAKLWYDLAKLSVASWVVKLFEPGSPRLDYQSAATLFMGLLGFVVCVRIGTVIAKGVNQ